MPKILAVDDSNSMRQMIKYTLECANKEAVESTRVNHVKQKDLNEDDIVLF